MTKEEMRVEIEELKKKAIIAEARAEAVEWALEQCKLTDQMTDEELHEKAKLLKSNA